MLVSQSHNNQIYNNTILNSGNGFNIISGSTNNKIYYNTIMNSNSYAILISNNSSGNTIAPNKIISSTTMGLKIFQDLTSKNTFLNNQIISIGGH